MATTYGLKTYKASGQEILTPTTKSGVFARVFELTPANATSSDNNGNYRKEFPEYAGRTLRIFQLRAGNAYWSYGQLVSGLNVVDYTFGTAVSTYGVTDPNLGVTTTILYIFIK